MKKIETKKIQTIILYKKIKKKSIGKQKKINKNKKIKNSYQKFVKTI